MQKNRKLIKRIEMCHQKSELMLFPIEIKRKKSERDEKMEN